jgi:hypothetical protein
VSDYPFEWKGPGFLVDALKRPLESISLMLDKHGKVETVAFWADRANGVRVHSNMHDVAERVEVGVLSFELTSQTAEGEQLVQFDHLLTPYLVSKLTVLESGKVLESGLDLRFSDGQEFLVVPSDFPCFLAVKAKGIDLPKTLPNTEYSLDRYDALDMS